VLSHGLFGGAVSRRFENSAGAAAARVVCKSGVDVAAAAAAAEILLAVDTDNPAVAVTMAGHVDGWNSGEDARSTQDDDTATSEPRHDRRRDGRGRAIGGEKWLLGP